MQDNPSFLQRFLSSWKSALIAGLLVLAPVGFTIFIFSYLVLFSDGLVRILPDALQPEVNLGFNIPGLGILLAFILVSLVGLMMRYYAGRQLVKGVEHLLVRLPLVRGIYQSIKQLSQTLFSSSGKGFQEVVVIEYPRKGIWCFAFLTNDSTWLETKDGQRLINIFLPSTPNPTTGFYLLIPIQDVYQVNLKVDEAFKLIMSAGIVAPKEDYTLQNYAIKNQAISEQKGAISPISEKEI
jgi:uncharacterized membrane protein